MDTLTSSPNTTLAIANESIADSLRADILRGKFNSGQALKQDEIAAQFGISKIPVREAWSN
jgi:DNA-binding GntR family transcriptional regulator